MHAFPESCSHALPEVLPAEGIMDAQPKQANFPKLPLLLQGGESRYCQKCCKPKPPRTHHCKVCKRCVLRFGLNDHVSDIRDVLHSLRGILLAW